MRALTVYQPWASLIMAGCKAYEFRRWNFAARPSLRRLVGQRIVIHAGVRPVQMREVFDLILQLRMEGGFGTGLIVEPATEILDQVWNGMRLPLGCGLGTVCLGQPVSGRDLVGQANGERVDPRIWGWPVGDARPFAQPVPARGAQGFWTWSGPCG